MEQASINTTWVYIFLGIYIIYAFYWGLKGYFTEKTSSGYTIGGRSIPFIAFLMAASAASFSGWTFIGHPGLIWRDGLAYAFASFYVLTIPITGAFFAKRNWLLGKRYGFITPGDMFAYYYNNEAVRWLVVLTAFLYSMFYSGLQLIAAASLFHWVAGVPHTFGLIFMAFIVWFYVVSGGLRASTWVGVLQFILLVGGIIPDDDAQRLRDMGVGPDTLTGVYLKRGPELMIAALGVLKAGGAYVPLDPEYPSDRVAYMIEDTEVPVLLTQTRLSENLFRGLTPWLHNLPGGLLLRTHTSPVQAREKPGS